MSNLVTVFSGDNTDILPTLPAQSAQTIITSPPYFGLRDYGIVPTAWPEVVYAPMHGIPPITIPAQVCCLGLESDPLAYIGHLVHVFRLTRRVLRDDGTVWLNLGDSYAGGGNGGGGLFAKDGIRCALPGTDKNKATRHGARGAINGVKAKDLMLIPARVALALQADGWWLRADIVWEKPNAMPESVTDRPTRSHEAIFLLAKSPRYYYDAAAVAEQSTQHGQGVRGAALDHKLPPETTNGRNGSTLKLAARTTRNKRTVWRVPTQPYPGAHYAVFPPALIEPCILAGSRPGDVVLDIYGGSGTTGRVAIQHSRRAWLIEINPGYQQQINQRTNGVQMMITEVAA